MAVLRLKPGPTIVDEIRADLKKNIVGQDYAIERFCSAIPAIFAGLRDSNSPQIILLGGPSDTGKTRFYEVVAESLSRLLGCEAGVIATTPDGMNIPVETSRDFRRPSIYLMEKIENINPQLLERMFDIDFGYSIIFMTTNVGSNEIGELYQDAPGQYL